MTRSNFYGLQKAKVLEGQARKLDVNVSVLRNPVEEMVATRRFFKRLSTFEADWIRGKADPDEDLLEFYDEPKPWKPLVRNISRVSDECFLLGYFAFVSNARANLEQSLDIYKLRNEAEVQAYAGKSSENDESAFDSGVGRTAPYHVRGARNFDRLEGQNEG